MTSEGGSAAIQSGDQSPHSKDTSALKSPLHHTPKSVKRFSFQMMKSTCRRRRDRSCRNRLRWADQYRDFAPNMVSPPNMVAASFCFRVAHKTIGPTVADFVDLPITQDLIDHRLDLEVTMLLNHGREFFAQMQ